MAPIANGSTRSLPNSIDSWEDMCLAFIKHFEGSYSHATIVDVGVLGIGVPRSTCWKAQLRPIYIDTTSSSSTSLSTQRAQDPRGGVSREEIQDKTGEGLA